MGKSKLTQNRKTNPPSFKSTESNTSLPTELVVVTKASVDTVLNDACSLELRRKLKKKLNADYIANFKDGVARVLKDGKWYYINKEGKRITEEEFDLAGDFKDDIARVLKDGKWYYINKEGEIMIEKGFDLAWNCNDLKPI